VVRLRSFQTGRVYDELDRVGIERKIRSTNGGNLITACSSNSNMKKRCRINSHQVSNMPVRRAVYTNHYHTDRQQAAHANRLVTNDLDVMNTSFSSKTQTPLGRTQCHLQRKQR
jgi:hypothetical protein